MRKYKFLCTNILGRDFFDDDLRFFGDSSKLNQDEWNAIVTSCSIFAGDIQEFINEQKEIDESFNYSIDQIACNPIKLNKEESNKEFISKLFTDSCVNIIDKSDIDEIKNYKTAIVNCEVLIKYKCSQFLKDYKIVDKNCLYLYGAYGGDRYVIFQEIDG
jgi:hypothetical protein